MSHAERLFASNCQLNRGVELDAMHWPTKTDNSIGMRMERRADPSIDERRLLQTRALWPGSC
ncbi:hypothetical protein N7489_008148 [Penicillium chrysogenum]|uniref:uncharacterized protein n=1 Tax=Penicillium chrysogenum TaxID=5076 RepID=UPI00238EF702|nr:uncharacterized protein N7489_008148 [Penicillium chrysogenum]KAJ5238057.1 hypothetical protein N7489_008148 [Penicillium chrysogenum]KAJ5278357.1 hypothetical protein N7524_004510 [Penicillium chrysogenum]